MYLLATQEWSATTWTLLFVALTCAILSVLVTFVLVLVRASRATDPPQRGETSADATRGRAAEVAHLDRRHRHHWHAA